VWPGVWRTFNVAFPMLHRVTVGQPARGLEGVGMRKAEHLALLRQAVDPELVSSGAGR
jgi:hypothetical protein